MFLRNSWYVAALSRDVGRKPLQKWMLGEPVVLFRTQAGEPVAMRDRCPHRQAPLSKGALLGDEIQCRYHGFQFDSGGRCTRVPGEKTVPQALRVDRFGVAEAHGFVWVWLGEQEKCDAAAIPRWPWMDKAGFLSYHTESVFQAPFQLIVDNLMDLTHVHFLHSILGAENLIHESEPMKTWEEGAHVHYRRDLKTPKSAATGIYMEISGEYIPPSCVITSGVPKREGSEEIQPGPISQVLHCLTPQTAESTRYFGVKCWNMLLKPHEIAGVQHQVDVTIEEDREMIEAQYRVARAAPPGVQEKLIRADRAAVMARRSYEKLLETQVNAAV